MKYLSITTVVSLLAFTTSGALAQDRFQEEFASLSPAEQAQVRAEAVQKEDYANLPTAPGQLDMQTVTVFCKLLPRGLETFVPQKLAAGGQSALEQQRTELWAHYLSCKDSLLYYEGHRFFDSGHYTPQQITTAISEIQKVMNWLVEQEKKLDTQTNFSRAH